jgi:hypothetical protein
MAGFFCLQQGRFLMKYRSVTVACCLTFMFLLLMAAPCLAGGVTVSYRDGTPAAHISVSILLDNRNVLSLTTDENGYFLFPSNDFSEATVSVEPRGGTEFVPVTLPSALVLSGDTALVLQPLL